MKNSNKNVARATIRTATQVVAIMAVILVTLIACGKSDSGGSADNKALIGTWKLESMTIDSKKEGTDSCSKQTTYTFLEKEGVIYVCALTKTKECKCESTSFTYIISGNTIVVKDADGEEESANLSIAGNKLTLSSNGENEEGNKYSVTMIFVKQ